MYGSVCDGVGGRGGGVKAPVSDGNLFTGSRTSAWERSIDLFVRWYRVPSASFVQLHRACAWVVEHFSLGILYGPLSLIHI